MEKELTEKCSECGREMFFAENRSYVGDYVICDDCLNKQDGPVKHYEPFPKKDKSKWTGVWIALFFLLVLYLYY
jgi:DNA-directed RNA polymerase subunit RPC12/RpoP